MATNRCSSIRLASRCGALALAVVCLIGPSHARAGNEGFYATRFSRQPTAAELSALGRALFFEPALSASGRLACAGCHDPAFAYGPPNALPVQRGGREMTQPGLRAVPSLRYVQNVPPFTEHFHDDDGDDSIDQGPAGGHDWDGRAQSKHEQASGPLLSLFEMANASPADVVAKVRQGAHAARFTQVFGDDVFEDSARAFKAVLLALEVFQQEPAEFYPYDSKFDAFLRGRTQLSAQERRGLALFNDPAKGNCASCHPSGVRQGALPQFTDFGFAALGVPRNAAIPANADARHFDLGLCGPLREDLANRPEYCGLFRTPSLRNVALRQSFFHNGVLHDLGDAVRFYVTRDLDAARWYPRDAKGAAMKFNDLPLAHRDHVNADAPFNRSGADAPALDDAEIADVVAFLKTLTDGYRP